MCENPSVRRETSFACIVCGDVFSRAIEDLQNRHFCSGYCQGTHMGRAEGAAVAFGLMGMAEAIRNRGPYIMDDKDWERAYPPGFIG